MHGNQDQVSDFVRALSASFLQVIAGLLQLNRPLMGSITRNQVRQLSGGQAASQPVYNREAFA